MNLNFSAAGYILFANTVLCLILAVLVWVRQVKPGGRIFGWLMLSLAFWSFMSAVEDGSLDYVFKVTCSKISYLGIGSAPALLLMFSMEYNRQVNWLKPFRTVLLWVIPVVSMVMAFTNDSHHLLWSSVVPAPGSQGQMLIYNHGLYFWIHVIFSYVCLLTSSILMVRAALLYPKKYRSQVIIILIASIIPWIGNVIYILGYSPVPGLDLTPLSFTLMAVIIAASIFRLQLFNLIPVARDQVVENMQDGVVVLDTNNLILDVNHAAAALVNSDVNSLLGKPINEVLVHYPKILKKYQGVEEGRDEIIPPGEPERILDVRVTGLRDQRGEINGRLFVLHDITQLKKIENKEREQRKLAEALSDSAAALNNIRDFNELLDRILKDVARVVPSDAASFGLVDENRRINFVRTRGYKERGLEEDITSLHFLIDEVASFKQMAETGMPALVRDALKDPNWVATQNSNWIRSYLGAPIMMAGNLLGFISLDDSKPNFFTEEHGHWLKAFADQAAVAIHNLRLFEKASRHAQEMQSLYQIGTALSSGLDLKKVIRELYVQCRTIVDMSLFYLAIYDENTNVVQFQSYNSKGDVVKIKSRDIKVQPGITGHIILERKTVFIKDIRNPQTDDPVETLIYLRSDKARTYLGIPLQVRKRIIGVLSLQSTVPDAFSPDEVQTLETIAVQAAIAIDNARLFDEMENQAITDGLTGLFNHRYFAEVSEKELARALRYQEPLSLIIIDLDHFKKINDQHGHLTGDRLLQLIAHNCNTSLRKIDILCRYGGEELAVLLPETSLEDARVVAERLREAVEASNLVTNDGVIKVTASLGVAEAGKDVTDMHTLIERADKALYAAKDAGRNCVKTFTLTKKTGSG